MTLILINGQPQASISVLDRGLSYGDGLFETMRVNGGDIALWQLHYERLAHGLQRLHIEVKKSDLVLHLRATMAAIGQQQGVLKLMVTRGEGARGYCPSGNENTTLISQFTPLNDDFFVSNQQYQQQGIQAHYCDMPIPINETLAGIKTLNQLPYVLASHERQGTQAREGLLFTGQGRLIEATARNIFLVKGNTLYTPPLNECGVAGVMRRLIIETIAVNQGLDVYEMPLMKKNLLLADEVFLSNSISQVWPVISCDDHTWVLGKIAQRIQSAIDEFIVTDDQFSLSLFLSKL